MRAVLISGGQVDTAFLREALQATKFELLIAADRGMETCREIHYMPDYIVGDFDSVTPETLEYYQNKGVICYQYPTKKDETDTELALRYIVTLGVEEIIVFGGIGTRLDHTLANMSLLAIGLPYHVDIILWNCHNKVHLLTEKLVITKSTQFGNYLSVLPITEQVKGLTMLGFAYPVEDKTLSWGSSLGVSNELNTYMGKITITSGMAYVIESRD